MLVKRRPFGRGTWAAAIILAGLMFNFKFADGYIFSHSLFEALNWPIYSGQTIGVHIPVIAAAVFWLSAIIIAKCFPNDYGANLSKRVGQFMLFISGLAVLFLFIELLQN